jgi:hypothetical protein
MESQLLFLRFVPRGSKRYGAVCVRIAFLLHAG